MGARVLVTGSTGNAGREVVRSLVARGVLVRAAVRSRDASAVDGVQPVPLDFHDRETWREAVRGCDRMFLVRPPAIADVKDTLIPFVDLARAQGVGHVVFLSVQGAEKNRFIPHAAVERHLLSGAAPCTLLRPGFFAQNFQDAYRDDIVADDRVYVPAGSASAAFVDLRDVADVAASALNEPEAHVGQAYPLTGPVAYSFEQAARMLSEALGRPIRYEPASALGYARHVQRTKPMGAAVVQTVLHVLLRRGQSQDVDPTLAALLDHPPRDLRDYLFDHAHVWKVG